MGDYVFMYVTVYTPPSLGDTKIIIFIENKHCMTASKMIFFPSIDTL